MDFKECIEREWGRGRFERAARHLGLSRSTFNSYIQYRRYPRPRQLDLISRQLAALGLPLDVSKWRQNFLKKRKGEKS